MRLAEYAYGILHDSAGVNLRKYLCYFKPFSARLIIENVLYLVPTNATRAFGVDLVGTEEGFPYLENP